MAVTNYYTVNGSIIGESTNGVRTDYLMDALGSVTGTVNSSAQVINTYRYKPFGDLLSKTGTGADPAFGWVGTQGYKQTQKKFSNFYVRARHYGSAQGRWTTVDWPQYRQEKWIQYNYCNSDPATKIDSTGLYESTELTCQMISDCFFKPRSGSRCSCTNKHSGDDDPFLAMCLFEHEKRAGGNMNTCGNHPPGYTGCSDLCEGPGNFTWQAFEQLVLMDSKCVTEKPKNYFFKNGKIDEKKIQQEYCKYLREHQDWCQLMQISVDFLACVGLSKYGPGKRRDGSYDGPIGDDVRKCSACILDMGHHYLPITINDSCKCCLPRVHDHDK